MGQTYSALSGNKYSDPKNEWENDWMNTYLGFIRPLFALPNPNHQQSNLIQSK
jgi:hypothetical protein